MNKLGFYVGRKSSAFRSDLPPLPPPPPLGVSQGGPPCLPPSVPQTLTILSPVPNMFVALSGCQSSATIVLKIKR